ncbi:hypothetical protein ONS96_000931 [Cadophora gregata f. sp. sojae]|nr:hypothetical protein ONS96_000931 [Cadophora gregata f. sp. sojae]
MEQTPKSRLAAHDAFMCVAFAESGVLDAVEPIEGRFGLLNIQSATPSPLSSSQTFLLSYLELMSTAIKPFPACRMTHGQIQLAEQISMASGGRTPVKITTFMSKQCFLIVGEPKTKKIRPLNVVDAQFGSYFQTAISWPYGSSLGFEAYDKIEDTAVHDLLQRIEIEIDDSYHAPEIRL